MKSKGIFDMILNVLFPKSCVLCGENKILLCNKCEQYLTISDTALPEWITSKYDYKDSAVSKVIFKIKYGHLRELAEDLGRYSTDFLKNEIENFEKYILVPVPISNKRLRERGYNQAYHIALGINKEKTFEILERTRDTQKLFTTKHRDDRMLEIQDSFKIKSEYINFVKDKNILIIDDITTTGATLYEIRKVLLFESAKTVQAFTLSH